MLRQQLAVASPLPWRGLYHAGSGLLNRNPADYAAARDDITTTLRHRYSARAVACTDSGTAALVLALRLVAGPGKTVAMPAYVCVDLIAAAVRADVQVRLYDIDPVTLTPDLESLRRVVASGADAVVVAHLYGFPVLVDDVRAAIADHGVPIIEDAAQGAGATVRGTRAGGLGDVAVLSFGRGKGMTSGAGGALLAIDPAWQAGVEHIAHTLPAPASGFSMFAATAVTWMLGRPALYGIPSSIPGLHLGETVYHDANEPGAMVRTALRLLRTTIAHDDEAVRHRRHIAAQLHDASPSVSAIQLMPNATGGYLRFPIRARNRYPAPALGIVRGYPRPLSEQPELQNRLHPSDESFAGAHELAASLLTLPTHHMVTSRDLRDLTAWLRAA